MNRLTKIFTAANVGFIIGHILAGELRIAAYLGAFTMMLFLFHKAIQQRDEAREHADNLARLLAAGAQVTIHRYVPVNPVHYPTLDDLIDAELHGHHPYSQGGTQPHLCVCGTPLEEHQ